MPRPMSSLDTNVGRDMSDVLLRLLGLPLDTVVKDFQIIGEEINVVRIKLRYLAPANVACTTEHLDEVHRPYVELETLVPFDFMARLAVALREVVPDASLMDAHAAMRGEPALKKVIDYLKNYQIIQTKLPEADAPTVRASKEAEWRPGFDPNEPFVRGPKKLAPTTDEEVLATAASYMPESDAPATVFDSNVPTVLPARWGEGPVPVGIVRELANRVQDAMFRQLVEARTNRETWSPENAAAKLFQAFQAEFGPFLANPILTTTMDR